MPCCFGGGAKEVEPPNAREQGMQGIKEMLAGYAKVATLALPPGHAMVLATIRKNIVTLESMLDEASFGEARFWRAPLMSEQSDWARTDPRSGILLRRQLCIASVGDEEWSLGGLFISDTGIAFDTGDVPEGRVQTGFLPWNSISGFKKSASDNTLILAIVGHPYLTELKVQLTIAGDAEWVSGFVDLQTGDTTEKAQKKVTIDAPRQQPMDGEPKTLLNHVSSGFFKQEGEAADPSEERSSKHRNMTVNSCITRAYAEGPGGRQAFHIPVTATPLAVEKVAKTKLTDLNKKIQEENFIPQFLSDLKQARDVSITPWIESKRSPGVQVRKSTFILPVTQDFPRSIIRMVDVPKETKVTAVFRFLEPEAEAEEIVMTVQLCFHDVPFGENFRVHETVMFKPGAAGELDSTVWVEVMWIADLPSAHTSLKSVIENKTKSKAECVLYRLVTGLQKA